MADTIYVGRRKTAIARVFLRPGKGEVKVNDKKFEEYFPIETSREDILIPFKLTNTLGSYDVAANVTGGGFSGQAEAVRLGIARALAGISEEYRKILRENGLLTRDPRMVERKKYGQKKARKRFQFSKR
jgi:small subunit ribosomal protein S9